MSAIPIPRIWRLLQSLAVGSAVAVLVLLVLQPHVGLFLTWYVLIPLVPVTLLVAPQVWRNLCPIASLSQIPSAFGARPRRRLPLAAGGGATLGAATLFLAIVPLRPLLFNSSAESVALLTVGVIVVAVGCGMIFSGKSGWCSTLCPVLPVERLYGQQPLVRTPRAHCSSCDVCAAACLDLRPGSVRELVAPPNREVTLLRTPMGVFAAALPGFIAGYFTIAAGADITSAYATVLLWSSCSAVVFGALSLVGPIGNRGAMRAASLAAVALYYWFTPQSIADATIRHLDIAPSNELVVVLRAGALGVVAVWALGLIVGGFRR